MAQLLSSSFAHMGKAIIIFVLTVVISSPAYAADSSSCVAFRDMRLRRVNVERVRETWLGWYNAERKRLGLPLYRESPQLNRTAVIWSQQSAEKKQMTHSRLGQTAYYDYPRMVGWFKDLGLEFKNINKSTFTESIGYGPFLCTKRDCTDEFISAIRKTFDFYMSEAGAAYKPHYNAIVNADFTKMGMGIGLMNGRYYITTHIGTDFVDEPVAFCRTRRTAIRR